VAAGIGILQFIFWRYRIAKGKTLAEATRNSERYDLTSPEALYYSSHGYARIRTGSYRMGSIDLTRLRALTSFQYAAVIIAGFGLASVVASAIVNHSPTATTTATVNQCYTAKGGAYCTGTWTVAGQTYSATLWGNGNTSSRPEPAVGSALTVTYDTRYPSVLGTQSVGGDVVATIVAALMATGLWFWGNTWYKPYRAAVDAIAAGPSAAAAARRPARKKRTLPQLSECQVGVGDRLGVDVAGGSPVGDFLPVGPG
jgi:hypothetical protein